MERRNSMMDLKIIDEELLYKVLSVPSYFGRERLMAEFLVGYAKENGYEAKVDKKGNVYITKGRPSGDGYYPCVAAHLDTVQLAQIAYIERNERIPLITEVVDGRHKIYADGLGLAADDKCGIVIALSIMSRMPVCKAAFFVEEENGCVGSMNADFSWFKDVGYIMEFDSPEGNCASWATEGVALFDWKFYENYLLDLGEEFGLTNYVHHPHTDVFMLRLYTSLACMNFGAGYYKYHSSSEYCIAEEMDNAADMGLHLIRRLGQRKYIIPVNGFYFEDDNFVDLKMRFQ